MSHPATIQKPATSLEALRESSNNLYKRIVASVWLGLAVDSFVLKDGEMTVPIDYVARVLPSSGLIRLLVDSIVQFKVENPLKVDSFLEIASTLEGCNVCSGGITKYVSLAQN